MSIKQSFDSSGNKFLFHGQRGKHERGTPFRVAEIQTFRSGTKTTVPGRLSADNTLYEVEPSGALIKHGPRKMTKKERIAERKRQKP